MFWVVIRLHVNPTMRCKLGGINQDQCTGLMSLLG